jgi:hypothetical protein
MFKKTVFRSFWQKMKETKEMEREERKKTNVKELKG